MDLIRDFINDFVGDEYVSTRSRYDVNINDEEQMSSVGIRMARYFHDLMSSSLSTYHRKSIDLGEKSLIKYKKPEKVQKRPLYQIRKYEKPKCGDVIKRVLSEEVIYLCYTGHDEVVKKGKSKYRRIFIVAQTDEGLKIISYFRWVDGEYEQLDRYEPTHIKDLGKLVGVEKFIAPEEETSLADYNKD